MVYEIELLSEGLEDLQVVDFRSEWNLFFNCQCCWLLSRELVRHIIGLILGGCVNLSEI